MAVRSLIVVLLVGLVGLFARTLEARRPEVTGLPPLGSLPRVVGDWVGEDYPMTERVAEALGADVTVNRFYQGPGGAGAWVFVAYFREQQVGSQIHSPQHCVPGSGWTIQSVERTRVDRGGSPAEVQRLSIDRQGSEQVMLYWFRTRSGVVAGEYALKLDLVKNSLRGRPIDAAFVRYTAPAGQEAQLRELISQLTGPLNAALADVGL
jgi:EpsI family protein